MKKFNNPLLQQVSDDVGFYMDDTNAAATFREIEYLAEMYAGVKMASLQREYDELKYRMDSLEK